MGQGQGRGCSIPAVFASLWMWRCSKAGRAEIASHSGPSSWQGASAPLLAALGPLLQPQLGGAACALRLTWARLVLIIALH
jgi:hypothetical protein